MNFKHLNFSAVLLVAVLAGCNGQPSAKENAGVDSSSAPVLEDNTPAPDSAKVVALLTELYNDYVFGRKEFDRSAADYFCTKKMADELQAAYEYEGGGYAVWKFRTPAQDGAQGDGLKYVSKKAPNVYTAGIVDNGVKASADFYFACQNGDFKIDSVTVSCEQ